MCVYFFFSGKIFIPKQKPVQTFTEDNISLDPELEEALTSASDTELCDLAGEQSLSEGMWGEPCRVHLCVLYKHCTLHSKLDGRILLSTLYGGILC